MINTLILPGFTGLLLVTKEGIMAKFAVFDENGFPKAFYDSNIHHNIPHEAVEITEEQWLEFINNQGKRKWNFETKQVEVYEPPPPPIDELKKKVKRSLSKTTDEFIKKQLDEIDEDLADLTSEAQVIEGRILYLAAKEGISITTDEVKQKIALFITGSYTEQDAINDLKEKGLSDETIQKILPLLQRGVEIAKILNWKEEIWAKESELEAQIDSMTLEQLLKLNVKALCEKAYKQIPIEV